MNRAETSGSVTDPQSVARGALSWVTVITSLHDSGCDKAARASCSAINQSGVCQDRITWTENITGLGLTLACKASYGVAVGSSVIPPSPVY